MRHHLAAPEMNNESTPSGWSGGVSLKVNGGVVLDGYQLLRPIGQGGYGQVWLARMVATGELCALKWIGNPVAVAREMKAVVEFRTRSAELAGVALCPIQHVGKLDDNLFYVMPLADGQAPGSALEEGWRPRDLEGEVVGRLQGMWFRSDEIVAVAGSLCRAAAALESVGLVHRDIKLGNVMYFRGKPCLADLGLVTLDDTRMSARGTPGYAAPSWYVESGGNPDMWGVCCVLFGLLTGHAPDKLGRSNFRWPPCGESGLEAGERQRWLELHRIILNGTSDDPTVRYGSLGVMAAAIEAVCGLASVSGGKPSALRSLLPMASALGVLAAGSVVLYFSRGRDDSGARGGASIAAPVPVEEVRSEAKPEAKVDVKPEGSAGDSTNRLPTAGQARPTEMKPPVAVVVKESVPKVSTRVVVPDRDDVVRDTQEPKDRANVFWKSKFTLFDLHTDEPIFPEMVEGEPVYRIFYCSAESRVPGYTELTPEQMERFLFYKFRNLKNCQDWCAGKEPEILGAPSGVEDTSGKLASGWLRLAGTDEETTLAKEELMSIVSGFWVRLRPGLMAELRRRAESGDAAAMGELAYRYRSGMGAYVDLAQARDFAKRGAALGDPLAGWSYGLAFRGAFGGTKDPALSLRYTSEAAKGLKELAAAGNGFAKNAVANLYLEGAGLERDEEKGYALFRELAEAGDANAMNTLSIRSSGSKPGYPKNDPVKIYWSARAIEAGSLDALLNLASWHRTGDGVRRDMRFTYLCWCKAAEAGDVRIMHDLAMMYTEGTVVPVDMGMANYWLEQGTLRGCSRSMVAFGTHLQGGWGMKADKEVGARYIREGAEAGELVGILNMGKITQLGIGVPVDQKLAFEWFLKAANAGSPHGYRELAKCYREGLGTEVNMDKALQMMERAAQLPVAR